MDNKQYYIDMFNYLGQGDLSSFNSTVFQRLLDKVDDIDRYKLNLSIYMTRGENEINTSPVANVTPLWFALWLISESADMGIQGFPNIDECVKLLILKGSDVNFRFADVSAIELFYRIKEFYTGDWEDDGWNVFTGHLTRETVANKIDKMEDYLTGKSVTKIQSKHRGNRSRLSSKSRGFITRKQKIADWPKLERELLETMIEEGMTDAKRAEEEAKIQEFKEHYMKTSRGGKKTLKKHKGGGKTWKPIKVTSSKPITLDQLRKKAIRKNRAQLIECIELELLVAQEKDMGTKWTCIFDGSALVNGKYISDFLLSGKNQKKGEFVYLNGVAKEKGDKHWMPCSFQICDGNILAWNCLGGTLMYFK